MSEKARIFVAGASRGVGREVVHQLVQAAVPVTALLRSNAAQAALEALGVTVVYADALDAAAIEQAVAATPVTALVSTVGGLPKDGQRADFLGNKNLIDAAVKAGVSKFILVSSIGAGNSAAALPPQALQTLGAVLAEKAQAEDYLIASGLRYTIIRPGGLKSEPATGGGVLTADPNIAGSIHRADVARLVCACLTSDRADGQVLSAVDRSLVYGQPQYEVFEP